MAALFAGLIWIKMIIGGLIILVPGVPFTTSIRDFFNGDYLSGIDTAHRCTACGCVYGYRRRYCLPDILLSQADFYNNRWENMYVCDTAD